MKTQAIALTALIAAVYAAMTFFLPIPQHGAIQVRLADSLSFLPMFLGPVGVAGLSLGCLVANVFSPYGVADMALGTLATVVASVAVWGIGLKTSDNHIKRNLVVAGIAASLSNAIIVGFLLTLYEVPYEFGFVSVLAGEIVATVLIGYPLAIGCKKVLPQVMRKLKR